MKKFILFIALFIYFLGAQAQNFYTVSKPYDPSFAQILMSHTNVLFLCTEEWVLIRPNIPNATPMMGEVPNSIGGVSPITGDTAGIVFSVWQQRVAKVWRGTDTLTFVFEICTTSTEIEVETGGLVIYPNPTNGTFTLKTANLEGFVQVEVTDIMGKVVYRSENKNFGTDYSQEVNLSEMANGIYIVRVSNGMQTHVQKLVKE